MRESSDLAIIHFGTNGMKSNGVSTKEHLQGAIEYMYNMVNK